MPTFRKSSPAGPSKSPNRFRSLQFAGTLQAKNSQEVFRRLYKRPLTPSAKITADETVATQSFFHQLDMVFKDPYIRWFSVGAFGIFFGLVGVFFLTITKLPPMLPLFYSMSWGEHQLISLDYFVLLPLIVPLVFLLHTSIASKIYRTDTILARLLFFVLIVIALLLAITQLKIVTLVMG